MKIPKLFKKAAAFVMAAVTALSIMPATAFAAGDIGTISFSHTYDSNGNAMRYNSSANIGGYTAGGTGNYKYRMFVDGENAFCIQPGVPLKTGNTLKKASSDTWNALSANQKKAVGLALLYGYQGNRNNLSGSDDEKWLATQTLVWEFVTGCREATGSYNQTSTTVYSLHFGSNYANSGARAVYDQIVAMLREHNTIPSFMSGGKNDITKELAYKDGKYSITLTDSNGVLSDYSFSSSDSNVSVSKSGNKLTISSTVAISGSVRITAKRNNVPTVSSSAKLIAYGDSNLQDLVTGVENADTVSAYINIETPTGTIALKKTSEDGVVEGISFTIKGDNFNKTVKTGKDGSVSVEGLFPGTYTVTEQSIDRYEPQKTQTVTLIGGKTSTVTFSNTLKRGSLEIVKTSEDNLVEGMKFHLYGIRPSYTPIISVERYQDKQFIVIWCPGGDSRPYSSPKTMGKDNKERIHYIRKASNTVEPSDDEEKDLFNLANRVPFDDRVNHQAEISDLNITLVQNYLKEINSSLYEKAKSGDFVEVCKDMNIISNLPEYIKPKNVGLMFFCMEPEKFFPCTQIDIVQFPDGLGGDNIIENTFKGPIHQQLREALQFIRNSIITKKIVKQSDKAEADWAFNYPYAAVEEALSNAVYHRAYDIREPIEVRVEKEMIEIVSFPGPDRSVTQEGLKKYKVSNRRYRNRRIGDILKELHLTEGRNTGFGKILRALEENGSPNPEFETDDDHSYFISRLFVHQAFLEEDELNKNSKEYEKEPKKGAEKEPKKGAERKQDILSQLVGNPEMTQTELMEKLGLTRKQVQKDIKELQEEGLLEREGSNRKGKWIVK